MSDFFKEREKSVRSFFNEYLTVRSLVEDTKEDKPEKSFDCDYDIKSKVDLFDDNVQEGQIRLLSQTEEITYIAILKQWPNDLFVIAPFSHFNFPATDEELKMSFDGGAFLRTLQIWNIRTLHVETLKQTWLVGKMSEKDKADAWQLWRYSLGRINDIGNDIISRIGLPIFKKEDPRLEYINHCLDNFSKLDSQDLATSGIFAYEDSNPFEALFNAAKISLWKPPQYALAAADEKENPYVEFTLDDKDISVEVQYDLCEQKLHIDVYGADGNYTKEIDGWTLVDCFNEEIAQIKDGRIRAHIVKGEWDGELAFRDANGDLRKLTPEH